MGIDFYIIFYMIYLLTFVKGKVIEIDHADYSLTYLSIFHWFLFLSILPAFVKSFNNQLPCSITNRLINVSSLHTFSVNKW